MDEVQIDKEDEKEFVFQFHLNADRMRGRGIRLRELPPIECDEAEDVAAREAGQGATVTRFRNLFTREAITRCIVAVTAPNQTVLNESTKWIELSLTELQLVGGRYNFDKLFNHKEVSFLRDWFRQWHEVTISEMEILLGKPKPDRSTDAAPNTGPARANAGESRPI